MSGLRKQVQPRDCYTLGVACWMEVEVEVVELVSVWSQGIDPFLIWKPGWGPGMGLCTASLPTGGN
jgi:hypothetical protein